MEGLPTVPCDVGWSDVGRGTARRHCSSISRWTGPRTPRGRARRLELRGPCARKVVALLGVEDVVVVDAGDALLVMSGTGGRMCGTSSARWSRSSPTHRPETGGPMPIILSLLFACGPQPLEFATSVEGCQDVEFDQTAEPTLEYSAEDPVQVWLNGVWLPQDSVLDASVSSEDGIIAVSEAWTEGASKTPSALRRRSRLKTPAQAATRSSGTAMAATSPSIPSCSRSVAIARHRAGHRHHRAGWQFPCRTTAR